MNRVVDFYSNTQTSFEQLITQFDQEFGVMWSIMNPEPRACFNKTLLQNLLNNHLHIQNSDGRISAYNQQQSVNYLVLASNIEGVFNFGGDLYTFKQAITSRDRAHLLAYAKLCIDNVWTFYNMQSPTTTIALVQGQALGGGFEAALSAHLLIAEKSAMMGLPEVLFNLFPGMGALSFLSRKVGMHMAEEMVNSGKLYTAVELYEMGVVDILAEDGEGEQALYQWIRKNHRSLNAYQAVQRAKKRVNPLTLEELYEITEIWVDAALRLTERDLKMMDRLVRAQNQKVQVTDSSVESRAIA